MGYYPSYEIEAVKYAQYLLTNKPDAKVGVLYQNDDLGKDFLGAFKKGLGSAAQKMIVREASYEISAPRHRLADHCAEGRGRRYRSGHYDPEVRRPGYQKDSRSRLESFALHQFYRQFQRRGSEAGRPGYSKGLVTASVVKDPDNTAQGTDKDVEQYRAFMAKWYPDGDPL